MNRYHYCKRCTTCTSCYGSWWMFQDLWYLKKRLLSNPLCNIICGILGWVLTRAISLWPAVSLDMSLLVIFVTNYILLDRWTSLRATNISTVSDIKVNLLQILVDWMLKFHNVFLHEWRLVLRLLLACSWFPPLWIYEVSLFTHSLLYKGIIGDELLWWYDIHVTHTNFLDKLRYFLVIINFPKTESVIRSILKDASDVA